MDSPNRFNDCIYIVELSIGDLGTLFLPISSTQKILAIRFFLNAPQETLEIVFRWLDAIPFAGRMVFPGKTYTVNLFHRAHSPLVRVLAHPGDDEVDPEHVAYFLHYKLFAARAEADLYTTAG